MLEDISIYKDTKKMQSVHVVVVNYLKYAVWMNIERREEKINQLRHTLYADGIKPGINL